MIPYRFQQVNESNLCWLLLRSWQLWSLLHYLSLKIHLTSLKFQNQTKSLFYVYLLRIVKMPKTFFWILQKINSYLVPCHVLCFQIPHCSATKRLHEQWMASSSGNEALLAPLNQGYKKQNNLLHKCSQHKRIRPIKPTFQCQLSKIYFNNKTLKLIKLQCIWQEQPLMLSCWYNIWVALFARWWLSLRHLANISPKT